MGFTTSSFLFAFFPISILLYFVISFLSDKIAFLKRIRLKDIILVGLSIIFYSWACLDNAIWLLIYIVFIYFLGFIIYKQKDLYIKIPIYRDGDDEYNKVRKVKIESILYFIATILIVLILVRYKYSDFINSHVANLGFSVKSGMMAVVPLGISFIVFSSISYIADIKSGKAKPGKFLDCALYLSFFPKIVSGPIVLWKDFSSQISERSLSTEKVVYGINRICIGFAKKVLLADFFGYTISKIDNNGYYGIDTPTVWITVLVYMLQIYYDFAGYSDIAIGLSSLFGFNCKENFNFPYRSISITDFWRHWHISLGTWFREYIYIPLGGNRKGLTRTLINLGIVFLLTGIWHGAGWNYIVWGLINAVAVICERLYMKKDFYKKVPSIIKWAGTMFIVMLFWQLFRYQSLGDAVKCVLAMFQTTDMTVTYTWRFFLNNKLLALIIVGIFGATVLGSPKIRTWWEKISTKKVVILLQEIFLIVLMALSIIAVVSSTYSPFIYFQY